MRRSDHADMPEGNIPADSPELRCVRLWAAVVLLAMEDARRPSASRSSVHQVEVLQARRWLSAGGRGRDLVLDAAGLDPEAFRDRLPRLIASWATPPKRRRRPGERWR